MNVIDNVKNVTYACKTIINLLGIEKQVSYTNMDGRNTISNSQYDIGWVKNDTLPLKDLCKFSISEIESGLDELIAQGQTWKSKVVHDYTIKFPKGSDTDTYRIQSVPYIGGAINPHNVGIDIKFYKGDSSTNPIYTVRFPIRRDDSASPFYRRIMAPAFNHDYIFLYFVEITDENTTFVYPAFETNSISNMSDPWDYYLDYNVVCNKYELRLSSVTTNNTETTEVYPPSDDEGGYGQGQEDEGSTPDTETDNNDDIVDGFVGNGFFIPLLPTNATLGSLGSTLWTDSVMQRFINKGIKFTDGIIDLFMLPLTWKNRKSANLNICGVDLGIITSMATTCFQYENLGTINVPTRFGSFVDYRGYSTLKIYLPCIGFRSLNINDYMGKQISLEYKVCVLDGSFIANISSVENGVKKVLDTFNGNCALHMPVSSGNIGLLSLQNMQYLPPLAIARRVFGQDNPDIHNSGNLSGTSAYLGTMTPYLVIDVPKTQVPQALPSTRGYMSHCMATLASLRGYTEVKEIHIDVPNMTSDEVSEMEDILKNGIII